MRRARSRRRRSYRRRRPIARLRRCIPKPLRPRPKSNACSSLDLRKEELQLEDHARNAYFMAVLSRRRIAAIRLSEREADRCDPEVDFVHGEVSRQHHRADLGRDGVRRPRRMRLPGLRHDDLLLSSGSVGSRHDYQLLKAGALVVGVASTAVLTRETLRRMKWLLEQSRSPMVRCRSRADHAGRRAHGRSRRHRSHARSRAARRRAVRFLSHRRDRRRRAARRNAICGDARSRRRRRREISCVKLEGAKWKLDRTCEIDSLPNRPNVALDKFLADRGLTARGEERARASSGSRRTSSCSFEEPWSAWAKTQPITARTRARRSS